MNACPTNSLKNIANTNFYSREPLLSSCKTVSSKIVHVVVNRVLVHSRSSSELKYSAHGGEPIFSSFEELK